MAFKGEVRQSIYTQLYVNRKRTKKELNDLRSVKRFPWDVYGSSVDDYEDYFGLGRGFFANYIEQHGGNPKYFPTLDAASDLSAINSLGVPGISVGLTTGVVNNPLEFHDKENKRHAFGLDILRRETWERIKDQAVKDGFPNGFKIVMARQFQGEENMTNNVETYMILLKRLYSLMDPNGSIAVLELPSLVRPHANLIVHRLQNLGLSAQITEGEFTTLIFNKTSSAPKKLRSILST